MSRVRVRLLDYGAGNLRSVQRALERAGAEVDVSADVGGEKLVVPGVGAFADARRRLSPVWNDLLAWVHADKPTLGICLGMQLLHARSHEHGVHEGLGVIDGDVVFMKNAEISSTTTPLSSLTIPNMGWHRLQGEGDISVYFAHSYGSRPGPYTTAVIDHGGPWSAVVRKGNVSGFQFHPEKSGDDGIALLRDWVVGK